MRAVTDPGAWREAGGDPRKVEILGRCGRVATFVDAGGDRVLAAIHPDRPAEGTLGDWVGGPAVLEAALGWLRDRGCAAAVGPALLAPWFPAGACLGPFDLAPFAGEPTERAERWLTAGFAPSGRWVTVLAPSDVAAAAVDRAAALGSRGWRIEPIETGPSSQLTEEAFDRAVGPVHRVATAAFRDGPAYLHVPVDVVADFYRPLRSALDPRLALFARDPGGEVRGFLLGLPGPTTPRGRAFQVLTLAVEPEFRSNGLATWLLGAAHQAARKAGYPVGLHTVRADALQRPRLRQGDVVREYALLRKAL